MNRTRLPLLLGLAIALSGATLSAQAGCSTAARQYINNAAAAEQQNDQADTIREYVAQSNAPGTIGTSGMSQCAGESFPVSLPGVASILSGVAKQVIQQACNQARSAVSQQVPSYLKGLYNVVSTKGTGTTVNQAVGSVANSSNTNSAVNSLFGGGK